MDNYYKNKNIVVTGGSSGLGRALCMEMAGRGAKRFVIADLDEQGAGKTLDFIRQRGGDGIFIKTDTSKLDDLEALGEKAKAHLGTIDIVFNNAGVASGGDFLDTSEEDWQWLMGINFTGVMYGCRVFGNIMAKQAHGGHIINTASLAAFGCLPGMSLYNTSKAAVVMLSETLRAEWSGMGIRVSAICPSFFKTNLAERTRTTTPELGALTNRLLTNNKVPAELIARRALDQIAKNKLYVLPTFDAKMIWRLRRWLPMMQIWLFGKGYPFAQKQIIKLGAKLNARKTKKAA